MNAQGIDVSKWQGVMHWDVAKAKVQFAYIKASENVYVDPSFVANWKGAGEAGILRGLYHFFRPGNVAAQASFFIELFQQHPCELPPAVDVEVACTSSELWIFCDRVEKAIGKKPVVYTAAWVLPMIDGDLSWLAKNPLWVADWSPPIDIPKPWTTWKFHQTMVAKGKGPDYGASSPDIDVDEYNGTLEELKAWIGGIVPPPPPPVPPEDDMVKTTVNLNIRLKPDAVAGRVIGAVPVGTVLQDDAVVKDAQGRLWYEVKAYAAGWLCEPPAKEPPPPTPPPPPPPPVPDDDELTWETALAKAKILLPRLPVYQPVPESEWTTYEHRLATLSNWAVETVKAQGLVLDSKYDYPNIVTMNAAITLKKLIKECVGPCPDCGEDANVRYVYHYHNGYPPEGYHWSVDCENCGYHDADFEGPDI